MRIIKVVIIIVGILLGISTIARSSANKIMTDTNQSNNTLSSHIEMGATDLRVSDMKAMFEYYQELVGLDIIAQNESETLLGYQNRPILRLILTPDLGIAEYGSAGLYHNAIVFGSRSVLAQTLSKIFAENPDSFQGSSDHIVSEAFYFDDPDGNGLELYFDKDPGGWQWRNGQVVMGSSYIDPIEYIEKYGQLSDDPTKKMGHVHLRVGDIALAKSFYVDILGMVITSEGNGALFVSDGKYHHHLGLNIWQSTGAPVRSETLGLKSLTMSLADKNDLIGLKNRLTTNNTAFREIDNGLEVNDPWGNTIIVLAPELEN